MSPRGPVGSRGAVVRERALLLRAVDYGEADRIVTLFTEGHGRVPLLARGWRRPGRRGVPRPLPPLTPLEVSWRPGRGELGRLQEAEAMGEGMGLLADWRKVQAGGDALAWLRDRLAVRVPEPVLFEATLRWIEELASWEGKPEPLGLGFRLHALSVLGALPVLDRCVGCARSVPPGRPVGFAAEAGGVRCRRCGGGAPRLSAAWRVWMRACCEGDWGGAVPEEPGIDAALRAVERFAEAHLSARGG